MDLAIETRDLVKVYRQGGVRAVDGLNLRVRRGEIYAFIGANGSGKTTSINMLTGALAWRGSSSPSGSGSSTPR